MPATSATSATSRRPGVGTSKRGDPTRLLPGECITDYCIEGKALRLG